MIYLDNAATSYKKPNEVIEAVMTALQGMGNAGRGVNEASLSASRIVFETRCFLDEMFHGYGPAQTAFTTNSTEALNTAISGTIRPGDHVITTMMEHNSVLRPLYRLKEQGVELDIASADTNGCLNYAELESMVRPDTRAIVCTHASNLTGNTVDIARIGALCKKNDILFIVDASQTAGVFPIDMQEMGIDILCVTGHKSLMGPQGTGAILVREGLRVEPLKVGGSGIKTYDKKHPEEMPTALEAGTLNAHGIAGLHASLQYIKKVGTDTIHAKEVQMASRFYEAVSKLPEIKVYGDFSDWNRAPVVTLNIGDYDSSAVSDALLMDYDIQVRSGGHCAPLMHEALGTVEQGAVRFSFGWFNTEEEVDAAIRAVQELAEEE